MNILAIIPARGGSKGIPGKNVKPLAEHPLIAWTIAASLAAEKVTRTIVSTDNEEIKDIALQYGAEVPFMRPTEMAQDHSHTELALIHAIETMEEKPDAVMLLQPTSPIRFKGSIDAIITKFEEGGYDSILSVFEGHHFNWRNALNPESMYDHTNRPFRQDVKEEDRLYSETGSMYVTKTEQLLTEKNRLGGSIGVYEMDLLENIDIDTVDHFRLTELIAKEWGEKLVIPTLG